MAYRQLKAEDFAERQGMMEYAFSWRPSDQEKEERKEKFRPELDWGVFDDETGKMLSSMTIYAHQIRVGPVKMGMGGLSSVATWPEARGKGCASQMVVGGLETMYREGCQVSMLAPFSFAYYRRFGWEFTVERKTYTLEARQLPPKTKEPGRVERLDEPDYAELNAVYEAYAAERSGMLVRDAEAWQKRKPGKGKYCSVYYNENGKPEGYLLHEIAARIMKVGELIAITEQARRALWTYIGHHDSMFEELTITVPTDDPLPFLLPDPRIKQELVPFFMTRIVNVESLTERYPWVRDGGAEQLLIALEDEHAPWNDGVFGFHWDEQGNVSVARVGLFARKGPEQGTVAGADVKQSKKKAGAAAAEKLGMDAVACDIQTLAALLLGGRSPAMLSDCGRLKATPEQLRLLERRIPRLTSYFADFF